MILLSLNIVMFTIVLCVLLPFGLFIWADKSGKAKKKRRFQDLAKQHGFNFTTSEYWNNACLGHDAPQNTLIYMNSDGPTIKFQKINLDEVKKCAINTITKVRKGGNGQYAELDRLELDFTFLSKTPAEKIILFTSDAPFSQNQEQQRAEKWLAFVNQHKFNKPAGVTA